ncbi:MAG: cell division protein FtsA [Bdellovibrionales bacterium]|jgi:cell division protein FtsA|nr:cell division protein FtsA [Bdellovibrionales bacterium]MBT3526052.1 cell division protein FtsA [Bdellovibrionales bacterium]MBT7668790.1 cell division protein FtsA [Bdellovibrionales bacterium]
MSKKNIIVGLDIGTTKVCTLIASCDQNGETEIIGIGNHASSGLKKGTVINIDKTVNSIRSSLNEARLMAGVEVNSASVGIAGNHIYSFNSSGVVAIRGEEVDEEDVERVLEAAKAVVIPSDREVLHVIPQEYRVDNTTEIKNPVGMCGTRLEVRVHIVTGSSSRISNLLKSIDAVGINTSSVTLQPIASSEAVLSSEEKDTGVVLIDIGGGTTDIAVWKGGSLVHTQVIPVGGNHFTNDLAVALKVSHGEAERIKVQHGCVLAEKLNQSAHITIQGMVGTKEREVQLGMIAEVLGARAEELFTTVAEIVEQRGLLDDLTGGYILTGGGALISGLTELGEYVLTKPTKIGYPMPFGGMTNLMQNPKFSTALGLLATSTLNEAIYLNDEKRSHDQGDLIRKLGDSLRSAFQEIF